MNKIRDLLEQAARIDTLPAEFSACSPVFLAALGCLTRISTTHPVITELAVSSEGWLLAKHEGDLGFDHALGLSRAGLLKPDLAVDCPSRFRKTKRRDIPAHFR